MQEKFIHKSLTLVSESQGHFVACVSTQDTDKVGDIVLQEGISFKSLPLPFLYEHNTEKNWVLGTITKSYIQNDQMMVEGSYDLSNEIESGLSDKEKFAKYESAKQGKDKLSIGFSYDPKDVIEENNVRIIKRCIIKEISQVKNPANPYTYFESVKSCGPEKPLYSVSDLNSILRSLYNKEQEYYSEAEQKVKKERKEAIKKVYQAIENSEKLSDIKKGIRQLQSMYAIKPEDLTTSIFKFFKKKYLTTKIDVTKVELDAQSGGNLPSDSDKMLVSQAETEKSQQINNSKQKSIETLLQLYISQKTK